MLRAAGRGESVSAEDVERLRAHREAAGGAARRSGPRAGPGQARGPGGLTGDRGRCAAGAGQRGASGAGVGGLPVPSPGPSIRASSTPWIRSGSGSTRRSSRTRARAARSNNPCSRARSSPSTLSLRLPPPGQQGRGLRPGCRDGTSRDLVWGSPMGFVEVKGSEELALTGNLKAMLGVCGRVWRFPRTLDPFRQASRGRDNGSRSL